MKHIRGIGCTYDQHQIALGTHGVTSKEALAIAKLEAQMASITVNGVMFLSEGACFGMCPYVNGETEFMLDTEDNDWTVTVNGQRMVTWHTTPAEALAEFSNQPALDSDVLAELARLGIGGGK